jgi:hypothetical protein
MGKLHVQVRLHGLLVEDRLLDVVRVMVIGDVAGSSVVFPGASVHIRRVGHTLLVLGRVLNEGDEVALDLPTLSVRLSHIRSERVQLENNGVFDGKFFAAALVIVLIGNWADATNAWFDRLPQAESAEVGRSLHQVINLMKGTAGEERIAAVQGPIDGSRIGAKERSVGEGPAHSSDDRVTGVGYHRWLKVMVPNDPMVLEADQRLDAEAEDTESRRIVAQAAYNTGHYRLAAWHYRWILDRHPGDAHAQLRLAWAERRQGRHEAELSLYTAVLGEQPDNVLALGGRAMAQARLGQLADAQVSFDNMAVRAPAHIYTEVTAAVLEAVRGRDDLALASLDRAIEGRNHLDRELQLELRRDIAVDPVFAGLRASRRLRSVLRKHLGAASPRGIR